MHACSVAQLCLTLGDGLLSPWNFLGKNTRVGCHFLLPKIFPMQESNPCLLCLLTWQVDSFSSVQFSRSVVSDSATPWIAACQASLSITNSRSLLKPMSIKSVMPSSHLILCHPLPLSCTTSKDCLIFFMKLFINLSSIPDPRDSLFLSWNQVHLFHFH